MVSIMGSVVITKYPKCMKYGTLTFILP